MDSSPRVRHLPRGLCRLAVLWLACCASPLVAQECGETQDALHHQDFNDYISLEPSDAIADCCADCLASATCLSYTWGVVTTSALPYCVLYDSYNNFGGDNIVLQNGAVNANLGFRVGTEFFNGADAQVNEYLLTLSTTASVPAGTVIQISTYDEYNNAALLGRALLTLPAAAGPGEAISVPLDTPFQLSRFGRYTITTGITDFGLDVARRDLDGSEADFPDYFQPIRGLFCGGYTHPNDYCSTEDVNDFYLVMPVYQLLGGPVHSYIYEPVDAIATNTRWVRANQFTLAGTDPFLVTEIATYAPVAGFTCTLFLRASGDRGTLLAAASDQNCVCTREAGAFDGCWFVATLDTPVAIEAGVDYDVGVYSQETTAQPYYVQNDGEPDNDPTAPIDHLNGLNCQNNHASATAATTCTVITTASYSISVGYEPLNTPMPTPVATTTATNEPTAMPTPVLTAMPTAEPSAIPTQVPTAEPTAMPTPVATADPTASPTLAPTPVVTAMPTLVPTVVPSPMPTVAPSAIPTATPTLSPTPMNTEAPTLTSTAPQTAPPSPEATALPTSQATPAPTPIVTLGPTSIPTNVPSPVLTPTPTEVPTPPVAPTSEATTSAPPPVSTDPPTSTTITSTQTDATTDPTNPATRTNATSTLAPGATEDTTEEDTSRPVDATSSATVVDTPSPQVIEASTAGGGDSPLNIPAIALPIALVAIVCLLLGLFCYVRKRTRRKVYRASDERNIEMEDMSDDGYQRAGYNGVRPPTMSYTGRGRSYLTDTNPSVAQPSPAAGVDFFDFEHVGGTIVSEEDPFGSRNVANGAALGSSVPLGQHGYANYSESGDRRDNFYHQDSDSAIVLVGGGPSQAIAANPYNQTTTSAADAARRDSFSELFDNPPPGVRDAERKHDGGDADRSDESRSRRDSFSEIFDHPGAEIPLPPPASPPPDAAPPGHLGTSMPKQPSAHFPHRQRYDPPPYLKRSPPLAQSASSRTIPRRPADSYSSISEDLPPRAQTIPRGLFVKPPPLENFV